MAIDLNKISPMGDTAAEYIQGVTYELDGDGEGLWGIVPGGRSFGFEGEDLQEFVRLCILRMLEVGGVPVRHATSGVLRWLEQTQYGTSPEEIAAGIIAEWRGAGGGDPDWDWLWFVTREVLNSARRWQASQPGAK